MKLLGELSPEVRERMLEAAVGAVLQGHDLEAFEPVSDRLRRASGLMAQCRLCGQIVWVFDDGSVVTLLADTCPGGVWTDHPG